VGGVGCRGVGACEVKGGAQKDLGGVAAGGCGRRRTPQGGDALATGEATTVDVGTINKLDNRPAAGDARY
jgi:hypothetical protein